MPEAKGLTTEDILADIISFTPPRRPENVGTTITEIRETAKCGAKKADDHIERLKLVGVEMSLKSGKNTTVYMTEKQSEQYKDWIIKE